jgi:hypothetical protein
LAPDLEREREDENTETAKNGWSMPSKENHWFCLSIQFHSPKFDASHHIPCAGKKPFKPMP